MFIIVLIHNTTILVCIFLIKHYYSHHGVSFGVSLRNYFSYQFLENDQKLVRSMKNISKQYSNIVKNILVMGII